MPTSALRDVLSLMLPVLAAVLSAVSPANADTRPNIIYILADDLGYGDLGCYGQEKIKTPGLDRLATEGMRFTQHYAGSTVCAPTRSCLMTGLHTGHTTVRGNRDVPLKPQDVTIAELLKSAGYATACIGKWGLGEAESTGAPWRQGFDYFFGYLNQTNAHFYYPPFLWRNDQKVLYPENDTAKRTGQYSHDLMTEEALGFVRRHKSQPFFLYLAYTIPHAQNTVPADSMEPYVGRFPEKPHVNKHYGDQPTPRASYAGMVSRLDRDITRLMALLRELDIDERTIVFFSSDNGPTPESGDTIEFFKSNGPFKGIKRDLYDGGIRVPLIVRWPGRIRPGAVSDLISAHWDMLPTMTDLAGLPASPPGDGVSIAPTLLGDPEKQSRHNHLYWEFYEQGGKQAVRMGPYKGIRLNVFRNQDGPIELYNIERDPREEQNLDAEHPEIVERIRTIMRSEHGPSPHFYFGVRRLPPTTLIDPSNWRIQRVDSESRHNNALASKVFDGDAATRWHTQWKGAAPKHPHEIVIDLGAVQNIRGFRYLRCQDGLNGVIGKYAFFVTDDPDQLGDPVAEGAFNSAGSEQEVTFAPRTGRYIALRAFTCQAGTPYTSCAELNVLAAN